MSNLIAQTPQTWQSSFNIGPVPVLKGWLKTSWLQYAHILWAKASQLWVFSPKKHVIALSSSETQTGICDCRVNERQNNNGAPAEISFNDGCWETLRNTVISCTGGFPLVDRSVVGVHHEGQRFCLFFLNRKAFLSSVHMEVKDINLTREKQENASIVSKMRSHSEQ